MDQLTRTEVMLTTKISDELRHPRFKDAEYIILVDRDIRSRSRIGSIIFSGDEILRIYLCMPKTETTFEFQAIHHKKKKLGKKFSRQKVNKKGDPKRRRNRSEEGYEPQAEELAKIWKHT